jgi:dTDP-4-dehydrorhamnose 3,5-epimerase
MSPGEDGPTVTRGGIAVDDRGTVRFVNDFDLRSVRRFYTVSNHRAGLVRAWHGHRREGKFATVLRGAALIGCVKIDDWDDPSSDLAVARFVLSASQPAVLAIPPGHANGFMSLTDDTEVMFFSTASLEDSLADDVRFPSRLWDPWAGEQR